MQFNSVTILTRDRSNSIKRRIVAKKSTCPHSLHRVAPTGNRTRDLSITNPSLDQIGYQNELGLILHNQYAFGNRKWTYCKWRGRLKCEKWKMRERKMQHRIAGMENAGKENAAQDFGNGKCAAFSFSCIFSRPQMTSNCKVVNNSPCLSAVSSLGRALISCSALLVLSSVNSGVVGCDLQFRPDIRVSWRVRRWGRWKRAAARWWHALQLATRSRPSAGSKTTYP